MRRLLVAVCLAIGIGVALWWANRPTPVEAAGVHPPLGINLAGVVDWSTEIVFVDAMMASRPWISQAKDKPFGQGGPLELDAFGNVKVLRADQWAETLMFVDIGSHYPGGKYILRYDGEGDVQLGGAATISRQWATHAEVNIDPTKGMVSLKLLKTNVNNPVRNIRLTRAEYDNKKKQIFDPAFLKRYQGFQAIRFMDWQRTNNSPQVHWVDRATRQHATQATDKGVCLELMIELANTLDIDPWFCIPHLADDDYVRQFMKLVKEQLKPTRKVYLEYSNETWNGMFEQAKYCQRKGNEFGLSQNGYEAQLRYSSQRSIEIFVIAEEVFDKERLVRVLAAQAENPWTGTTIMDWKEHAKKADAIAIAPYFGNPYGDPKTAEATARMSVTELLDGCETMLAKNKENNAQYAREAKKRGLQLLAYESGQHLVGFGGAEDNERLTKLFHEANRHPRMKELYLKDLQQWKDIGGGLNCIFSSVGRYSKWGSWGLLEYSDQIETTAPKYQAIQEFIRMGRSKE